MAGIHLNTKEQFFNLQKQNILDQLKKMFPSSLSEEDLQRKADLLLKIVYQQDCSEEVQGYFSSVQKDEIEKAKTPIAASIERFFELMTTKNIRKNNKKTLSAIGFPASIAVFPTNGVDYPKTALDSPKLHSQDSSVWIVAILWPKELLHAIAQKLNQSKNFINVETHKTVDPIDLEGIEREFLDDIQRKFDKNALENLLNILALIPNAHLKTEGLKSYLDHNKREQIEQIKKVFPIIPRFILDHDPNLLIKDLLQMIENSFKDFIIPKDWKYLSETIIKKGSQAYTTDFKERKIPIQWTSYNYNGLEPKGQAKYIADTVGDETVNNIFEETSSNLNSYYTQIIQLIQGYKDQDTEAFFLDFAQYCLQEMSVGKYGQELNPAYITDLMEKGFLSCCKSENNQDFIKIPNILLNDLSFYIESKHTEIFHDILIQTGLPTPSITDPKQQLKHLKQKFQSNTIAGLFSKIKQQEKAYKHLQNEIYTHQAVTVNNFFDFFQWIYDREYFKTLLPEAKFRLISNLQGRYADIFKAENAKITNAYNQGDIDYIKALPFSKDLLDYLQEGEVKTYVDLLTQFRTKVQSPQVINIPTRQVSSLNHTNETRKSGGTIQLHQKKANLDSLTQSRPKVQSTVNRPVHSDLSAEISKLEESIRFDRENFIQSQNNKKEQNARASVNIPIHSDLSDQIRQLEESIHLDKKNFTQLQKNKKEQNTQLKNPIIENQKLFEPSQSILKIPKTKVEPTSVNIPIHFDLSSQIRQLQESIHLDRKRIIELKSLILQKYDENSKIISSKSKFPYLSTDYKHYANLERQKLCEIQGLEEQINLLNQKIKHNNEQIQFLSNKIPQKQNQTHLPLCTQNPSLCDNTAISQNYAYSVSLTTTVVEQNNKDIEVTNEVEINFPMQPNKNKIFSSTNNLHQLWRTASAGTEIPIKIQKKESLV